MGTIEMGTIELTQDVVDAEFALLSLQMEPMESLEAPWGWGSFFAGVGIGLALVGIFYVGVAIT